jgi:uncharacterized protein YjiS (DUF1127 family)
MEMIMSISCLAEPRGQAGGGALAMLAAAVRYLCVAYITWRMEQSAVALLHAMSDRKLSDIGLSRSDITGAGQGHPPWHTGATATN